MSSRSRTNCYREPDNLALRERADIRVNSLVEYQCLLPHQIQSTSQFQKYYPNAKPHGQLSKAHYFVLWPQFQPRFH